MMADTGMTYKTQKKIDKAKNKLRMTISYVQADQLHNKVYKLFKELAKEMVDSVQYVINHRGAYENAGWDEANVFNDEMSKYGRFNYNEQCNLQGYMTRLIDNLKY
tara:strand:+ start:6563 stop:6880 length:318 start_codon:yes stop_codon:yes gene_type:complete